jgi:hypothetical protein
MATVRLDTEKVERIVAQVLRDDYKMRAPDANAAASAIAKRLLTSTPAPNRQGLQGHRIIAGYQPMDDSFTHALAEIFPDVNRLKSNAVWGLVYGTGVDLPDDVADPRG